MYHKNSMATASLIFGILAILSGSIFIIAIGLGALSVLCALLSKTDRHLSAKSLAGMLAGIIAAVSSCVMTAYSFYSIMNNPQARAYYSQVFSTLLEAYGLLTAWEALRMISRRLYRILPHLLRMTTTTAIRAMRIISTRFTTIISAISTVRIHITKRHRFQLLHLLRP